MLGAAAQIPVILTGSIVSLLNLEMSYLFSSLFTVSYLFVFVLLSSFPLVAIYFETFCKIYTGVWANGVDIFAINVNIFGYLALPHLPLIHILCL